jgi:hypothetical protein
MGKKSRSGTYFRKLRNNFWVKILTFFVADPDPGSGIFLTLDLVSGMEKFRVRDKHTGSSTLLVTYGTVESGLFPYYCIKPTISVYSSLSPFFAVPGYDFQSREWRKMELPSVSKRKARHTRRWVGHVGGYGFSC